MRHYRVKKLTRSFGDIDFCSISFNTVKQLMQLVCLGENITAAPYGPSMQSRYGEIKQIVSRRFGKGESFERQDATLWKNSDEWWMSLKTGRGVYSTYWRDRVASVMLKVEALSNDSGYYLLAVEHRERMANAVAQKNVKEQGQF
jgi:hypothetical protein